MANTPVTVVRGLPAAATPTDPPAAGASGRVVTRASFAALLSERVDALAQAGDEQAPDAAHADPHARARDEHREPSDDATAPPLLLAALPPVAAARRWPVPAPGKDAADATPIAAPLPAADAPPSAALTGGAARGGSAVDGRSNPLGSAAAADAPPTRVSPAAAPPETAARALASGLEQAVTSAGHAADPVPPHAAEAARAQADAALPDAPAVGPAPVPTAAPTPVAPTPIVGIAPPVHAPGWGDAVGNRVAMLVHDRIQAAELHVNPPELGPVSVRIDVAGSQAHVVFGVPHAETRHLLTEALPRLAELLGASGITLAGAQVGAELPSRREDVAPADPATGPEPATAAAAPSTVPRGLVDVFA